METESCVTWWNVQTHGPDWGRLPDDVLQVRATMGFMMGFTVILNVFCTILLKLFTYVLHLAPCRSYFLISAAETYCLHVVHANHGHIQPAKESK